MTAPPRELSPPPRAPTILTPATWCCSRSGCTPSTPTAAIEPLPARLQDLNASVLGGDGLRVQWAPWFESEPAPARAGHDPRGQGVPARSQDHRDLGVRGDDADTFTDSTSGARTAARPRRRAIVEEEIMSEGKASLPGLGSAATFTFGTSRPAHRPASCWKRRAASPCTSSSGPRARLRATRTEEGDRIPHRVRDGALPAIGGDPTRAGRTTFRRCRRCTTRRPRRGGRSPPLRRHRRAPDCRRRPARLGRRGAQADGASRARSLIARFVARLHREVRYTGIEFGDASITPRRPAEVLGRGYGDCKDKAALLVALLRAASVPAAGRAAQGVGPRHRSRASRRSTTSTSAIVYVPPAGKSGALWIDATNPYAPVGELPRSDAGRRALLANPRAKPR